MWIPRWPVQSIRQPSSVEKNTILWTNTGTVVFTWILLETSSAISFNSVWSVTATKRLCMWQNLCIIDLIFRWTWWAIYSSLLFLRADFAFLSHLFSLVFTLCGSVYQVNILLWTNVLKESISSSLLWRLPHFVRQFVCFTPLDLTQEDNGNYTCEIHGPHNVMLAQVTHSIIIGGLNAMFVFLGNLSVYYTQHCFFFKISPSMFNYRTDSIYCQNKWTSTNT